jgi:hypothetical protein
MRRRSQRPETHRAKHAPAQACHLGKIFTKFSFLSLIETSAGKLLLQRIEIFEYNLWTDVLV